MRGRERRQGAPGDTCGRAEGPNTTERGRAVTNTSAGWPGPAPTEVQEPGAVIGAIRHEHPGAGRGRELSASLTLTLTPSSASALSHVTPGVSPSTPAAVPSSQNWTELGVTSTSDYSPVSWRPKWGNAHTCRLDLERLSPCLTLLFQPTTLSYKMYMMC